MREILNIASVKEFKDLLDGDWKTRRKILEEDLGGKFDEKTTRLTQIVEKVTSDSEEMRTSLQQDLNKRLEALRDDLRREIQEKLNQKMEGIDGQLNLFFSKINNINIYMIFGIPIMVIGFIIFFYKRSIHKHPLKEETTCKSAQVAKRAEPEAVIQNFGDLMKVEPHKLVIIFVDSNAKNIILENPESEIGDFKNQATDVFISLGCDVFVVYCKDKGSQNLSPDNLYNPKLTSVERHPVLRKLKERERVISVNTKFHPHQVSHLESLMQ
ncbi:uncharacterized protein LOC111126400 isoform X2 [Crassostrea virginica]